MTERLDIILFGVTGFTGKHVLQSLYKLASAKERKLKWGVAGRNENKIRHILDNLMNETADDSILKIPIISANLSDMNSIESMASKARLIINCCGPYRIMGETVVKACVAAGTHHVDISGEMLYMEKMQLNYNEIAKEKNIYIVSACGLDSIPTDLGVTFLNKHFRGTLNSVETYLSVEFGGSGTVSNYGTWESAVHEVGNDKELEPLRSKLFPNKLPRMEPVLKTRNLPFRCREVENQWAVLFPGSDRSVMMRTQRYFYEEKNNRPIQVETYLLMKKLKNVIMWSLAGLMFLTLVRFKFGRTLLLKYPRIFTFGYIDKEEPTEESTQNTSFNIKLVGKGWTQKIVEPESQFDTPPNKGIIAQVSGKNPGYGATATMIVLSAIVILTEPSKLPKRGGVYTPGTAFANTSLIEQLNENHIPFEIVKEFDIAH